MADGSLGLGIALGLLGATLPGKKAPEVCGVHRVSHVHLVLLPSPSRQTLTFLAGGAPSVPPSCGLFGAEECMTGG